MAVVYATLHYIETTGDVARNVKCVIKHDVQSAVDIFCEHVKGRQEPIHLTEMFIMLFKG